MTKIVYNSCFGGFGLSDAAVMRYAELKEITLYPRKERSFTMFFTTPDFQEDSWFYERDIDRKDPVLVQVVEEMGEAANGDCADLRICELSEGTQYRIEEYDGRETIMTRNSYDWRTA